MIIHKFLKSVVLFAILMITIANGVNGADDVKVNSSVDLYNRYVWRGLDIANSPSIQPALSIAVGGFEIGTWGAYTLSNEASESDEIDFWMSYSFEMKNGVSLQLLATDYYLPNAGIKFFNFNNHDAVIDDTIPDPGAHMIELGLSVSGPVSFPVTLSGYMNVYNDAGNNTYFQVDYPVTVGETELGLFCGIAGGNKDNSDYYITDEVSIINLGVSTIRKIKVSESFSLPLTFLFTVNPNDEISYLVVGANF